jgi:hypothetical protein
VAGYPSGATKMGNSVWTAYGVRRRRMADGGWRREIGEDGDGDGDGGQFKDDPRSRSKKFKGVGSVVFFFFESPPLLPGATRREKSFESDSDSDPDSEACQSPRRA